MHTKLTPLDVLPLGEIDDFATRYLETFASSRMPMAIVTYAASIASLRNAELNTVLSGFVTSVLNGSFKAKRCQLENNLHLQTIEAYQKGIVNNWMTSLPPITIESPGGKGSVYHVVDSDDPIDLMLCGTEVEGSCQKVDGKADMTKGLLGYLVDGKNRLLAVKDSEGKIVARCIMRLMWDGEKPVLFREIVYSSDKNNKHEALLNSMAHAKAKKLNLPLLCEEISDIGNDYGKPLHSLSSPSPWEYCDAARGIAGTEGLKMKGVYTISSAQLLR